VVLKALLNFAAKLNGQPTRIGRSDIDALHTYGYNDEQILETCWWSGWRSSPISFPSGLEQCLTSTLRRLSYGRREAVDPPSLQSARIQPAHSLDPQDKTNPPPTTTLCWLALAGTALKLGLPV
jgi:hypothetical protein